MNIAIICSTPFQTFNAINLVINEFERKEYKVDLYYRNFDNNSDEILNKIKKARLFDNIYSFDFIYKKNLIKYIMNVFYQIFYPEKYINLVLKDKEDLTKKSYDLITVTSGTEFEVAMTRLFPNARTIAYDDGIGSYVGDIIHDQCLNWFWLLVRSTKHINPECLYINNISFCESKISTKYINLKRYQDCNEIYKRNINQIFSYNKYSLYRSKTIVYLTQPMQEFSSNVDALEFELQQVLLKYSSDTIIRKHPRDSVQANTQITIDKSNLLWELICAKELHEKHVLISVCSTAQMTPKLMFNKEPYLIFTYKIFIKKINNRDLKVIESIVNKICDLYINKEKVLIPKSISEFQECLQNIKFDTKLVN